jgi:hypothetical protein
VVCERPDSHFLFKWLIVNVLFLAVFFHLLMYAYKVFMTNMFGNLFLIFLCFSASSFEW